MVSRNFYSPEGAYGNSKAAQVMFTQLLNSKLSSAGDNVEVNCVHPGVVRTDLYTNADPLLKVCKVVKQYFYNMVVAIVFLFLMYVHV